MKLKMRTLVIVLTLLVIAAAAINTPSYTINNKHAGYEERSYPVSWWVSTTDHNPRNIKTMFLRLFYYMQGANSQGRMIEMSAPLLRHNEIDGNVSLLLFVPDDKPPIPTDPAVNITSLPPNSYVVRVFGGFATDEMWEEELKKLKELVIDDGNVTTNQSFYASYSGLHDVTDRRNEVWLIRMTEEDDDMLAQP